MGSPSFSFKDTSKIETILKISSIQIILLTLLIFPSVSSQGQNSSLVAKFLSNLDTDLASSVSRRPPKLSRFEILRSLILQPFIENFGTAVESVSDLTQGRSSSLRRTDKVRFLLYSDKMSFLNETFTQLISEDDSSIKMARFNIARPIKMLIHGFQASGFHEFPQITKNAYLRNTDYNVIVVDWADLSYAPISLLRLPFTYFSSVESLQFISNQTVQLIQALNKNGIINSPNDIHIIAFSLGSQIAGLIGHTMNKYFGSKIGRITALEPASPLFKTASMEMRIDKSDAKHVEVVHTSRLGLYQPLGHVDFYPNGGRHQDECYLTRGFQDALNSCSHGYAYLLFSWSIENKGLIGCRCNSWEDYRRGCKNACSDRTIMGEYSTQSARGTYFLETKLPSGLRNVLDNI